MIDPDINEQMARYAPSQRPPRLDRLATDIMAAGPYRPVEVRDPIADSIVDDRQDTLAASLLEASKTNPDEAARALQLARDNNVGTDIALRNMNALAQQARIAQVQDLELPKRNPILSRMLEDREFARVAQDDIKNLNDTGSVFRDFVTGNFGSFSTLGELATGATRARLTTKRGQLSVEAMTRDLTPFEEQELVTIEKELEKVSEIGFLRGAAEQVSYLYESVPYIVGGVAKGAVAGAVAGAAGGPLAELTVPAGTIIGSGFGAQYGIGEFTYVVEAGNAYRDMVVEGRDVMKQRLDAGEIDQAGYDQQMYEMESSARSIATGVGLANAVLEVGAVKLALAPFRAAFAPVLRQAFGGAIKDVTRREAFKILGFEFMKQVGGQGATELVQEVNIMIGEDLQRAYGSKLPTKMSTPEGREEVAQRLIDTFEHAVVGFTILGTFGPTAQYYSNVRRAESALQTRQFFSTLSEQAKAGNLMTRSPEMYQRVIAGYANGTDAETTYINGRELNSVLQQLAIPREEFANRFPDVARQLDQAMELDQDVTLPTAEFAAKMSTTNLGQALLQHVRVDPRAMSPKMAEEFLAQRPQLLQEAREMYQQKESADQEFVASGRRVEQAITADLEATGQYKNKADVRAVAQVARDMYTALAKRTNTTPEAVYEQYRNRVQLAPAQAAQAQALEQAEQFDQAGQRRTDTPEFREWFRESKIVKERGQPRVVYHGTDVIGGFTQFVVGPVGEYGRGIYFTTSPETASNYAGTQIGAQVIPAYVSISKPLIANKATFYTDVAAAFGQTRKQFMENAMIASREDGTPLEDYITDTLRASGYDGVVVNVAPDEQFIVAFDPTQVKSPNNLGTWSRTSPNILRQSAMPMRLDADYMAAVERGDMETAQRMVDEAASQAPWPIHFQEYGYHYTANEFTVFDNTAAREKNLQQLLQYYKDVDTALATNQPMPEVPPKTPGWTTEYGRSYAFPKDAHFFFLGKHPPDTLVQTIGRKRLRTHLFATRVLDLTKSLSGAEFSSIADWMKTTFEQPATGGHAAITVRGKMVGGLRKARKEGVTPQQLFDFFAEHGFRDRGVMWRDMMRSLGYDAIMFDGNSSGTAMLEPMRGVGDGQTYTVVAVLDPNQIKLADPVTYDEAGNVVPLSRRFDITSPRIFEQRPVTPGFYSALEREVGAIDAKALTADGWNQRLQGLVNKGVVKQDEIEWSGLKDWIAMQEGKVSKDTVLEFLRGNGVRVERVVLGDTGVSLDFEPEVFQNSRGRWQLSYGDLSVLEGSYDTEEAARAALERLQAQRPAKYKEYTLPGGTNYREVLLRLPRITQDAFGRYLRDMQTKYGEDYVANMTEAESDRLNQLRNEPAGFKSTHWDSLNVLVHLRLIDRVDADGKRVLFVEEVQSDWGQAGVTRGFVNQRAADMAELNNLFAQQEANPTDARKKQIARVRDRIYKNEYNVSRAPYVETTEGWLNLGLKQIMLEAVTGNYDRVAFVNGEQSADRYSLSKQVSLVSVNKQADGRYLTYIEGIDGTALIRNRDGFSNAGQKMMTAEELEATFGKEVAKQAIEGKPNKEGWVDVRGDNLRVGGKGMKEFYDNIVPAAMNKLLKKYGGGKLGVATIDQTATDDPLSYEGEFRFRNEDDVEAFLTDVSIAGLEQYDYGRQDDGNIVSFRLPGNVYEQFRELAENRNGRYETPRLIQEGEIEKPALTKLETQQPAFDITPAMVEKLSTGLPLFQAARGQARGWFDPITFITTLTSQADQTTFLHELAHFYLSVLMDVATTANPPAEITADLDNLFQWFGIDGATQEDRFNNWLNLSFEQQRKYHEQFAYSFEIYLFENKAPSIELRGAFARFASWFRQVYRNIRDELNAIYREQFGTDLPILTPEIRSVMDRMLADEDQIARQAAVNDVKAYYQTQEESGMDDATWLAYQMMAQETIDEAVAELTAKSLRNMQWLDNAKSAYIKNLQKKNAALRAEVREEVEAELELQRQYRTMQYLKRGVLVDVNGGEQAVQGPHKLDSAELKQSYDSLPESQRPNYLLLGTGRYGMIGKDGVSAEVVANLFGYGSGDEMIRDLLATKPLKDAIEERTDAVMLERYGDLQDPKSMERAANAALQNDARARFLAVELRNEAKATQPARFFVEAAKQAAEEFLANKKLKNLRPIEFVQAESRNAKDAQDALRMKTAPMKSGQAVYTSVYEAEIAAGVDEATAQATAQAARDAYQAEQTAKREAAFMARFGNVTPTEAIIRAKRAQLFNNQLARQGYDIQDQVRADVKYMRRVLRPENVAKMDASFVDQLQHLLTRFNLATMTQKQLEDHTNIVQWMVGQEEAGVVFDFAPGLINPNRATPYQNLTVQEFRDLVDAVKQIEYVGKNERKVRLAGEKVAYGVKRDQIVAAIRANWKGKVGIKRQPITPAERRMDAMKRYFYDHLKAASVARIMDGGQDGGPMWEYLIRSANEAGDMETTMRAKATKELTEILKPLFARGKMGGTGTFFPSINRSMNREARLVVALNMGNASNIQRMLDGEGWTMEQVMPILNSMTEAELLAVQAVWDYFESFRPLVGAKERRINGQEPKWVEPQPMIVKSADGKSVTLRGGYYPIVYDRYASFRVDARKEQELAREQLRATFTAATTRRTHTKTRVKQVIGQPIVYSLAGLYNGVNDVIHDLSWHEWLIQANRLMRDPIVLSAIRETYGPQAHALLKDWIDSNAEGERGANSGTEGIVNMMRHNISVTGLGFSVLSAASQITGFANSFVRVGGGDVTVGAKWVGRGIAAYTANPARASARVRESSEFMANRARTQWRELNEIRNQVQGESMFRRGLRANSYVLMTFMQGVVDIPTWMGAYEKAIDGGFDDETAIALADQAVIDSQGSGMLKDLAGVERGGPMMKLFTVFYSYMNVVYNQAAVSTMTAKSRAKYIADMLTLLTVPVVLNYGLRSALTPNAEDDEEGFEAIARDLIAEQLSYLMGTMVIVREAAFVSDIVAGKESPRRGYEGPAGLRLINETGRFVTQAKQGEFDRAFRKSLINMLGVMFGLPSAQINRTVDGLEAIGEEEVTGPEAALAPLTGVER